MSVSTKKMMPVASLACAAAVAAFVFANAVNAATRVKANNQDNLNSTTSWSGGVVPGSGDVAQWNNTVVGGNTTLLGASLSWQGVQTTNPGGWITINAGNALTLGTSGIDNSTATQSMTINCDVALGANQAWNVASGMQVAVTGVISGAHSLTKNGTGLLSFAGNNTYSTTVTVNAGTVHLTGTPTSTTLKYIINGGTVSVADRLNVCPYPPSYVADLITLNGGTFSTGIVAGQTYGNTRGFTIGSSGGTIDIPNTDNSNDVYIAGVITGTGSVTKTGVGTLGFTNNNNYTGQTIVSNGILVFDANLGVKGGVYNYGANAGTIVINSGGTVRMDTNDVMGAHTSTPTATVDINAGGTMASNATFTTLNNLTISGGTLLANGGTPTWGAFSLKGTVTIDGTTLSNINAGTGSDNNVFIGTNTGGGTTTFNVADNVSGNDLAVSTVLTNNRDAGGTAVASGLIKTGAGTMTLLAGNTYTGQTTVSAGILSIDANGSLYTGGTYAGTIVINNGGTVRLDRGDFMGIHTSTPAATFTVNAGGTLANSASYFNTLNNLTLTGGTLQSNGGNGTVWGTFALKGTVTVNGSVTSNISTGSGTNNYIFIGTNVAGGTTTFNVANNVSGDDITVSTVLSDNRDPTNPYPTVASGLTKTSAGTMVLSGANTYTGVTTISGGTISVGTLANGGTASNIGQAANTADKLVINGGTLSYTGGAISCDHLFTVGASGATIDASGSGALNLSNAGSVAYSGSATHLITLTGTNTGVNTLAAAVGNDGGNAVTITKSAAGEWALSGNNTYSGGTNLSAGTLDINGTTAIGAAAARLTITNGATLDNTTGGLITLTNNNPQTWNGNFTFAGTQALAMGAGAITLGATPTITVSASTLTEGGAISGSYGLTKAGNGTLTLSGSNAYTGATTISAGTLKLGASGVIPEGSGKGNVSLTGTLDLNSYSEGINGISGAGTVTSGVSGVVTLTIGNNDATSSFSGLIQNGSGTMSITKTGAGTLTLSNSNTYTGVTTISGGTISVATLANGGTASNIGQAANTAAKLVIDGGILSYTGGAISCDHLFTVGASGATIDASGSGALNLSNAGSFAYTGSATHLITLTGTNTGVNTLAAVVGNDGANAVTITKSAAGEWALSGNNTYSGGTNLSAGTLDINGTTAIGATAARLTISNGATLDNTTGGLITLTNNNPQTWNGNFTFAGTQALAMGAGAVTLGATPTITVSASTLTEGGAISGSYGLTKSGSGTLVISNTSNAYTGTTTISAGTLKLGASEVIPDGTGKGDVSLAATLDLNSFSEGINGLTGVGTVTSGVSGAATLTIGNNNITSSFGGIIQNGSGTVSIAKAGSGALTLSGNNTYSGGTNLNVGTLNINGATAIGAAAARLTITSGTTFDNTTAGPITLTNNNPQTWNGNFTFTGTQALNMGTGAVTLGATPQIMVSASTLTEGGAISGSYGLTKLGNGTLTLSGNNSYSGSGGTTLSAGTININSATALGATAAGFTLANGTTFDNTTAGAITLTNNNPQTWNGNFTFTGTQALNMGAGAVTLGATPQITIGANTLTEGGAITGPYGLTEAGSGTLVLSNTGNAYTGTTTISAGTLQLGASGVIPDGSGKGDVSIAASGTLDLNNFNEGINGLTDAGTVDNTNSSTAVLTIGNNNATSQFDGLIQNSGSGATGITKAGSGTLTLTGPNTYTGTTTVSTGTLMVTNTSGSATGTGAVNVSSGATLGGTGTIGTKASTVTINSGATLSPGPSIATGILTINDNLTFGSSTSVFSVNINGPNAGVQYDQLVDTGTVTLASAALTVTLGYFPTFGQTYTIMRNNTAVSGTFNGIAEGGTKTATYNGGTYTFTVSYVGGAGHDIVLTCSATTEMFSPLGVQTTYTSNQLTAATIAAHNWTIKFDATNAGGGISWLSPDSLVSANQLATNSNLFTIYTDGDNSSASAGTLTLLDSSNVFVRILQKRTIGTTHTLPYSILYTILGNGKVYVQVSTYASTATTPTGGLEFRICTNGGTPGNIRNYAPSATAANCNYLLHCDATSTWLDPCLALFENWSQATSITGTLMPSTGGQSIGILSSSWSIPPHRSQAWEFMIDLAHRYWTDSTGVGAYISEYQYSHSDSLLFYSGTPYLEKAWEDQLSGHWKLDEGTGDTAWDNSVGNNVGIRTTGCTWTWTKGQLNGGLTLGTADSVKIVDNTAFNGSGGFTILSWIKPGASLAATSKIFRKYNTSGSTGYAFTGASNGSVQLNLNGTAFSGRTSVGSGSWRHVGAVYQKKYGGPSDTVKLYIDGKPDTVISGAAWSFDASGNNASMGPGYNGSLDDVRFYNEALSDEAIKAIYQIGYAANQGMYYVRADNNSAVNLLIDGGTYIRYFPAFQVTNYWNGAALGANSPYVYLNGTQLTYNTDYYVMLDGNRKRLTIGFNRAINADGTHIYIGGDPVQAAVTTAMPCMYWGSFSTPSSHFYLKNFSASAFGAATANQYYFDFKMDNTVTGNGGEIYRFKTSKISPFGAADTTATGNLVSTPASPYDTINFGCAKFKIGTSWLASTANVEAAPTYTVVESSAVRIVLQINDRTLKHSQDSCYIRTWFAFYPTGQIFRWDSVSFPAAETKNLDTVRYDVLQNYAASGTGTNVGTISNNLTKIYGGIYGATNIQDYAAAFLFLDTSGTGKLNGGVVVAPSIYDSAKAYPFTTSPNKGIGTRFVHCLQLAKNKKPYQFTLGMDIQRATFTSALIDSVRKGLQWDCAAATEGGAKMRLIAHGAGSTATSAGDYDTNGFNEREGAYVYQMDNMNSAHFYITALHDANGDTCRLFPAFRLTHYYATTVPQYVFVNNQQLVQRFGYNAYLKQSTSELILQLNQKLCGSNIDIYISSDKTLAVTMDDFGANGGDASVRLRWRTESEENNLGFFLYRRIQPRFIDSLMMSPTAIFETDTSSDSGSEKSPGLLFKTKVIGFADSTWKQVNDRIIYGAMAGVSYGKRAYSWLDRDVHNNIQYDYKLVAVDYNNGRDAYNKLAEAMPHRILPAAFELHGNFPNPFRSITYLKFDLPVKTRAMLNVYSLQGRLVRHIVRPDKSMKPGFYSITWDCKDDNGRVMASGPYIYRFSAPGFAKSKIMIMMK